MHSSPSSARTSRCVASNASKLARASLDVYLHGARIGIAVAVSGGDDALVRDLAMHVAASAPAHLSTEDVPEERRNAEKEVLMAQARDSGKPEDIIEKMVEGRLRKFLAEITLMGQPFVKDPDFTVEKLVSRARRDDRVDYARLEVGEGIEKKEEDFAAEVQARKPKRRPDCASRQAGCHPAAGFFLPGVTAGCSPRCDIIRAFELRPTRMSCP